MTAKRTAPRSRRKGGDGNKTVPAQTATPVMMARFQATMPLSPGTRLGSYDVIALIGGGWDIRL